MDISIIVCLAVVASASLFFLSTISSVSSGKISEKEFLEMLIWQKTLVTFFMYQKNRTLLKKMCY